MLEIEKKAHLSHPEQTLNKIKSLEGITYQGFFYKQDLYFTKDLIRNFSDIKKQKIIFRVRYVGNNIYLTLKFKKLVGHTEVNQEIEVLVCQDHHQELSNFLNQLGFLSVSNNQLETILNLKTREEWIAFWTSQGFFYLLSKEKKTELFTLQNQGQEIAIEWNEITDLGFFIEIEVLTQKQEDVQNIILLIDMYMEKLDISSSMEEPKLYLELLFEKRNLGA